MPVMWYFLFAGIERFALPDNPGRRQEVESVKFDAALPAAKLKPHI